MQTPWGQLRVATKRMASFVLVFFILFGSLAPGLEVLAAEEAQESRQSGEMAEQSSEQSDGNTEESAQTKEGGEGDQEGSGGDDEALQQATQLASAGTNGNYDAISRPEKFITPTIESLNSDHSSGALTYSFPFALPPGRNGLSPDLALTYNSHQKSFESLVGHGWELSLPTISRINREGTQALYDKNYFTSSLSGEIVPVDLPGWMHGIYGARDESGSFVEYEYLTDESWVVRTKDGTTYFFGSSEMSRQAHPEDNTKVHTWFLDTVKDANGNTIHYSYQTFDGQVYPLAINYQGHEDETGVITVDFTLEDRLDTFKSYARTFKVRTNERIAKITTSFDGWWVSEYTLSYGIGDNQKLSLLESIDHKTRKIGETAEYVLPPTSFAYTSGLGGGWSANYDYDGLIPMAYNTPFPGLEWGSRATDINGDGYADLFRSSQNNTNFNPDYTKIVKINTTDANTIFEDVEMGIPAPFVEWYSQGTNSGTDSGTRLIDVNSDGFVDIVQGNTYTGESGTYLNKADGTGWNSVSQGSPGISIVGTANKDNGVRFGDMNGDGRIDALRSYEQNSEHKFQAYRAHNSGTGWSLNYQFEPPIPFVINSSATSYNLGVRLLDINGDGLVDIMKSTYDITKPGQPSKITFDPYINKGDGSWELDEEVQGGLPFLFIKDWNFPKDYGTRIADFNNDGLVDLYTKNSISGGKYFINTGDGKGWEEAIGGFGIPTAFIDTEDWVDNGTRLLDYNGDGALDVIRAWGDQYSSSGQVFLNERYPYAHLLEHIDYGTGATSDITYKSSALYKNGDELANPILPTTMSTVESITHNDGLGNSQGSTFHYAGGQQYYENVFMKQFGGFAVVTETNELGHVTKRYFHQGNETDESMGEYEDSRPKIGKVYREETYDAAGNLYRLSTHKWESAELGVDEVVNPFFGQYRNFVYEKEALVQMFDGNADSRDTAVTNVYDETNGNILEVTEWGEVNGASDGTFADIADDARTTAYTYASPNVDAVSANMTAFPSSQTVTDMFGVKVRETIWHYDNAPVGQVEKGNPTLERYWIDGENYAEVARTFNTFGLPTQELDPNGNPTTFVYDQYALYPELITNALGHETFIEYNYAIGQPKKTTDPNGRVSEVVHDGFGRVLEEYIPDDSLSEQTVLAATYTYDDVSNPRSVTEHRYLDETNAVETISYIDGYDRPIQVRVEAQAENEYSAIDSAYNEIGGLAIQTLPYFSNGSAYTPMTANQALHVMYTYDPLGRVIQTTNAVGTTSQSFDQWSVTTIDANGNQKDLHLDAYGRLAGVTEYNAAEQYETAYKWNHNDRLVQIIDAQENTREFVYDGLGRRLSTTDLHKPSVAEFGIWEYVYDAAGNVIEQIDPKGQHVLYEYDGLNRKTYEVVGNPTLGSGNILGYTFTYDMCENGLGRLCHVVDNSDKYETEYTYTGRGLIKEEGRGLTILITPIQTEYQYNRRGDIMHVASPGSVVVSSVYDQAGMLVETTYSEFGSEPEILTSNMVYGPTGALESQTFGSGVATQYTYDSEELYRLKQKIAVIGEKKVQDLSYAYDSVGNITQIVDASDTLLIEQLQARAPGGDVTGNGIVDVVDTQCATLLSLWSLSGGTGEMPSCVAEGIGYLEADIDCSDNINVTDVQSIINLSLGIPLNTIIDADQNNVHDSCDAAEPIIQPVSVSLAKTTSYEYDDLYRLVEETVENANTGEVDTHTFGYDEIGNITANSILADGYPGVEPYVYATDDPTEIERAGKYEYIHDDNGNIRFITDLLFEQTDPDEEETATMVHAWDYRNRLFRSSYAESPGVVSGSTSVHYYYYDHNDVRFGKLNLLNGKSTTYVNKYYEYSSQEENRKHLFSGNQAVATITNGAIAYHVTDHLSSNSIDLSQEGDVLAISDYRPYGGARTSLQTESYDNNYKYTGKELDNQTGLYYYGARYYKPEIGRFTSIDPAFLLIGEAKAFQQRYGRSLQEHLSDPQGLHPYAYARNNPITYTDPTGESGEMWNKVSSMFGKVMEVMTDVVTAILPPFSDGRDTFEVTFGVDFATRESLSDNEMALTEAGAMVGIVSGRELRALDTTAKKVDQAVNKVADAVGRAAKRAHIRQQIGDASGKTINGSVRIPSDWVRRDGSRDGTYYYHNPNNYHEHIRLTPKSRMESEPYMKIFNGDHFVDSHGNPLPSGNVAEAHITIDSIN